MSHLHIVEISTERINKKDCHREIWNLYDDSVFTKTCDWGGNPVDDYDRALTDVKVDLKAVATVNLRRRTITFRSREAVLNAYRKSGSRAVRRHGEALKKGFCENYKLLKDIEYPCGIRNIYHKDYCLNGGDLIEDYLNGHLPKTLYIGTVCNGHY